jgi:type IV pilus assembly protein PilB
MADTQDPKDSSGNPPLGSQASKSHTEELKIEILAHEEKRAYYSERFEKIRKHVHENLWKQNTDEVLKDITVWALLVGSSDIHYEVYEKEVIIRFRIDWVLVDIFSLTHKEYKAILERLKYSAGLKLNITEVPQDGKYSIIIEENKKIDIRVSILPTKYGENGVCRVLDSRKNIIDFEELWFFWTSKRMVEKSLEQNTGMILVTGPTGSWKTTTLYTMIGRLNTRDVKIITLEDPIEYEMIGVVQSEVDERKWLTFEVGLKSLMRQDPDIIMVWEIRDAETLNTAVNASLTWHLVISTLHTKSAAETLDRLRNMGLQNFLIASSLNTIIAQRLVRKICTYCKTEKVKTPIEEALIKDMMAGTGMKGIPVENIKLYHWAGCEKCHHSGFHWRIGVYEIINLNERLRDLIRAGAKTEDVIKEARSGDLITMNEDGILKAIRGHTTIEEILRVI